jgi:hypothetical protein
MVPQADSQGSQRLSIPLGNMDFETVLDKIHNTIGCADVNRKPILTYKLSNALRGSAAISFASEDDWNGLLEDVATAEAKVNKRSGKSAVGEHRQNVPVNIIVPEDVCAHSLLQSASN